MHPYLINHSDLKPGRIKPLPNAFFKNASDMSFREIAYVILDVLLGDEIVPDKIKKLVDDSLSDTTPFSPEAEAAFVAALWADAQPKSEFPTLLCAVEPEDYHLVNELSKRTNVCLMVPKGTGQAAQGVNLIEIQGSATDCVHLCAELQKIIPVCTLHNAVASAVRVAVAVYLATHPAKEPSAPVTVNSAAMLQAYETAIRLGLKCGTPILINENIRMPEMNQTASHQDKRKSLRVAPTVDAVMRIIKTN